MRLNRDPDWVWHLKGVIRRKSDSKDAFDFRIFDEIQLGEKKVKVENYTSLNEHHDLILYQGWFDKKSMHVEIEETKVA